MAAENATEVLNITAAQTAAADSPSVDSLSVDPTAAEALLTSAQLGQRIKRLRLKRSMGLVELGRQTGLSASFALVFNKDLSWFFESTSHSVFRLQRRRDRVRLSMGAPIPDYIAESFGILIPEGGFRPCLAEFLAGDERSAFLPEIHSGVEMVYVLHGSIELRRKGEPHILGPGDVCYISGETTRSYRCFGDEPARALIITFDRDCDPRRPRSSPVS
jgi:hypothetical protein